MHQWQCFKFCSEDSLYLPLFVPLLPVHQSHGLEAGAILDLSWHWLGALDAALGYIEGNVHARGDGPRCQTNRKLPQELKGRVLVKKKRFGINIRNL